MIEFLPDVAIETDPVLRAVGGSKACGVRMGMARCGQPAIDACEYCHTMVCEHHAEKHSINGETSVRCPRHALGGR